jgi:PAS domain S-box-containing protein
LDAQDSRERFAETQRVALAFVGAIILDCFSLFLTREAHTVAAVWPADGVLLALALMSRVDTGRWIIASNVAAGFISGLVFGDKATMSLAYSTANTIGLALAYVGTVDLLGTKPDFRKWQTIGLFMVVVAIAAPVSGALGALNFFLHHASSFTHNWLVWGLSGGLSYLIFTPLMLVLASRGNDSYPQPRAKTRVVATSIGFLAVALALFSQTGPGGLYFIPLFLVVVSLISEVEGTAVAILLTALVSIPMTTLGHGPIAASPGDLARHVGALQIFLVAMTVTILPAAAAISQARRLREHLVRALGTSEMSARGLAEELRLWRMAEEIAEVGYWRVDLKTRQVSWSDEMFRLFGVPDCGRAPPLDDIIASFEPAERENVARDLSPATRGEDIDAIMRVTRLDGDKRDIRLCAKYERDDSGEITHAFGVVTDVTDVTRAQEALRDSELRFRMLAENASDLVIQLDMEGTLQYVSPSSERIIGLKPGELIGKKGISFIHPDDVPAVQANLRAAIAKRSDAPMVAIEYRFQKPDGTTLWLESLPSLIFKPGTQWMTGLCDIIRDVTARKEMEGELVAARQRAEASAAAETEFLANMSHEIRTPLTSVIGFSELLMEQCELEDRPKHYASRVRSAGQALLATVNDILDYSKLEAGQVEIRPEPVSAHTLAEEALRLFSPQAEKKAIALQLNCTPWLARQTVSADTHRLRQLLLNLIGNAVKFTDTGSVTLNLSSIGSGDAHKLRCEIVDTGPGVPEDQVARLFKRFSQIDGSVRRRHGGTGLGLAICKGIVDAMKGKIGLIVKPGTGSTFWFEIPAPIVAGVVVEEEVRIASEANTSRILVVDDRDANRVLVHAFLKDVGADLVDAESGEQAVELAKTQSFDLVLMDLQMPGMTGVEAMKALRSNGCTMPILAFSADADAGTTKKLLQTGFDGIVSKPIAMAQLRQVVERALAGALDSERKAAHVA